MARESITVAREENVVIEAGACRVKILPEFGGKIASICVMDSELLQAPLLPVAPRTRTMAFDASDASGWDECLPSVAACAVTTEGGIAEIPDHGDLWRVGWQKQEFEDKSRGSFTLRGECFSLPLLLERTVDLVETKRGWRLDLKYVLKNTGRTAVPWSWAAHPLFAVDEGDRIELPASIEELRVEGSGGNRLGSAGDMVGWPVARSATGEAIDLRVVQPRESKVGEKLFAGSLQPEENWCVLHRVKAGVRVRVGFDAAATPYLGLWLCYGGWPGGEGQQQMCVAMEPATAPVDSLAQIGEWSRVLGPGAVSVWPMSVEVEMM
jgi:galactose mutarotase-like enzyme